LAIRRRRILSIGHSYCVALNRRLPTEMAKLAGDEWEVTAAAPSFFHGDLRPIKAERFDGEKAALELLPTYLSRSPHVFFYGMHLRELLSREWDVVHCWEEPYVLAGGQVAWLTRQESRLVFWTGQTRVKDYPPPFAQIERYCFRRCAGWLSRGQLGVDAMLARGHGNKPHEAIGLGVDIDTFRPDRERGLAIRRQLGWDDSSAPIVGYLGRFVDEKGLGTLMAALDAVSTPWRAFFVGGGPMDNELRTWSSRHADRVRIVPAVTHDRVPDYLNAFDLLCAPSRTTPTWREIFGRMIIEAFACRVPVLSSDSGELPSVIADAGMIVAEDSVAVWTRALELLLSSPEMRDDFAARGFERVHRHFTWSAIAQKHLEFFGRLLGERASVSR
jgi:glycosyltransferase involved in cell wall biosynthesis